MVERKFAVIVIAVGLILSIGIMLGQLDKDQYAKELASKENGGTDSDAAGSQMTPGGIAPFEMAPSEPIRGRIATRLQQGRTFDSYKILSENLVLFPVDIECYYGNNLVGEIYFLSDEEYKRYVTGRYYLAETYPVDGGGEYIRIYYPISRLDEILSILRNEIPLTIWINEGEVPNFGGIGTGNFQPVGGG